MYAPEVVDLFLCERSWIIILYLVSFIISIWKLNSLCRVYIYVYACMIPWEKELKPTNITLLHMMLHFVFSFIFISWTLITLQYCSGFCHTLTWINHGFTCIPHPDSPSHLPLYPILLGFPSAPGPSTCLMWCYTFNSTVFLLFPQRSHLSRWI